MIQKTLLLIWKRYTLKNSVWCEPLFLLVWVSACFERELKTFFSKKNASFVAIPAVNIATLFDNKLNLFSKKRRNWRDSKRFKVSKKIEGSLITITFPTEKNEPLSAMFYCQNGTSRQLTVQRSPNSLQHFQKIKSEPICGLKCSLAISHCLFPRQSNKKGSFMKLFKGSLPFLTHKNSRNNYTNAWKNSSPKSPVWCILDDFIHFHFRNKEKCDKDIYLAKLKTVFHSLQTFNRTQLSLRRLKHEFWKKYLITSSRFFMVWSSRKSLWSFFWNLLWVCHLFNKINPHLGFSWTRRLKISDGLDYNCSDVSKQSQKQ